MYKSSRVEMTKEGIEEQKAKIAKRHVIYRLQKNYGHIPIIALVFFGGVVLSESIAAGGAMILTALIWMIGFIWYDSKSDSA